MLATPAAYPFTGGRTPRPACGLPLGQPFGLPKNVMLDGTISVIARPDRASQCLRVRERGSRPAKQNGPNPVA